MHSFVLSWKMCFPVHTQKCHNVKKSNFDFFHPIDHCAFFSKDLQGDPIKMGHFIWSLIKSYIIWFLMRVFYTICQQFVLAQSFQLRVLGVLKHYSSWWDKYDMNMYLKVTWLFGQENVATFLSRPESYGIITLGNSREEGVQ